MSRYRCDMCGCYLDPGEGLLCDECREKVRNREQQSSVKLSVLSKSKTEEHYVLQRNGA